MFAMIYDIKSFCKNVYVSLAPSDEGAGSKTLRERMILLKNVDVQSFLSISPSVFCFTKSTSLIRGRQEKTAKPDTLYRLDGNIYPKNRSLKLLSKLLFHSFYLFFKILFIRFKIFCFFFLCDYFNYRKGFLCFFNSLLIFTVFLITFGKFPHHLQKSFK